MVKVMDFRSDGSSTCRFDSWHGRLSFFFMMIVEHRVVAQASASVDMPE